MSASDNERRSTGASASWLKSNLAAVGSAAVLTVYSAGYVRTRAAADQFSDAPLVRRAGAAHPISLTPIAAHPSARPAPQPSVLPAAPTSAPETATHTTAAVAPTSSTAAERAHQPVVDAQTTKAAQRVAAATVVAPATEKAPASAPATAPAASTTASGPAPTPAPAAIVAASGTPAAAAPAAAPTPANSSPAPTSAPAAAPAAAGAAAAAAAPAPAHQALAADDPSRGAYKDGTYLGWGTSRHGDIQAKVVVQDGWIVSATIAQCLTQYSCSWIDQLPPEVTARQSADIDYVTGATQSSNAFYGAVQQAIAKAK